MADENIKQVMQDAILDADSLERFINGSDDETVLTRLSAEYPTLQKAIKELFENGGIADRFKTLADLQVSPLVDGDYALVADDTDDNNGIYIKEGGTWVKSQYDIVSIALDKLNATHSKIDPNQVTPMYKNGVIINYNPVNGDGGNTSPNSRGRYAVLEVSPNTTYYVAKKGGKRFAIFGYTQDPSVSSSIYPVEVLLGSDSKGSGIKIDSVGNMYQDATITTGSNTQYIAVYGVQIGDEDKDFVVQVTEGSSAVPFLSINKYVPSNIVANGVSLIPPSKNILSKADVIEGGFVASSNNEVYITDAAGLTVFKVRVKRGYTYKLSGLDFNRLIIFLSNQDITPRPNVSTYFDGRLVVDLQARPEFGNIDFDVQDEVFAYIYIGGGLTRAIPPSMHLQEIGSVYDKNKSNANFLEFGSSDVYTSHRAHKTSANDDTSFLQSVFDAGGVVNLDGGIYKVSAPVTIDLTKITQVNGNGATIVSTHEGIALKIVGNLIGTANPFPKTAMSMLPAARVIKGLRVTSANGFKGTGVSISKTFMLDLDIQVMYMQHGIVVTGGNRNLRLRPKVYAMTGDALTFSETCNLHQSQVYNSDISYCSRAVFIDGAELYNIQFLGGDIESSFVRQEGQDASTPNEQKALPKSLIHIKTDTKVVQEVLFANLTLEDHGTVTEGLIVLETKKEQARFIRFADCFYGNSSQAFFNVGGVYGLSISGFCDSGYSSSSFVKVGSESYNIYIDVNYNNSGKLLEADGDFTLHNTIVKAVATDVTSTLVRANCNIDGFILSNNCFSVKLGVVDTPIVLGSADSTVSMVQIANNTFNLPYHLSDIVVIQGTASNCLVQGNISNKSGGYPASSGSVVSKDNYSPSS